MADLLLIYVDSFTFILGSVILQYAFDPKNDRHWCAAATLLCICGYLTGKYKSIMKALPFGTD
ncbi:hypothetical protein PG993_009716 [Apiospora rasikravindrae]|uniref:Uncharacterized protein n=1 Tax=Apiospora rasikravindrae TaxID=990691 RepID=A0ABR1SK61_9PEZI